VEIDADRYLDSCFACLKTLASALPADAELLSVAAASASGNILFLDKDGKPLTPVINWQDKRTANEPETVLGQSFDKEAYFRSTGWGFDGKTFPLASLCRLKVQSPELFNDTNVLCMSTEYLYRNLTGNWGLSTSAGTPFYLIDQVTGQYRTDVLATLGLSADRLPPVVPVGTVVGRVTPAASAKCGLPVGTAIVAGTFDHPSAARGVGVLKPGQMLLSCGTSWVGFYPLEGRDVGVRNHLLIDPFLSEKNGAWAGMVSLASVASRIEDYIRKYLADSGNIYKTFESLSAESQPGAGGLCITLSDADDENVIRSYPKKHIARAIMEGVVNMLQKDFERLAQGGVKATSAVMVGGPTECPLWTKVIEGITGMPVEIRHGQYAGAVGAAMVAGIGAGVWPDEAAAGRILNG